MSFENLGAEYYATKLIQQRERELAQHVQRQQILRGHPSPTTARPRAPAARLLPLLAIRPFLSRFLPSRPCSWRRERTPPPDAPRRPLTRPCDPPSPPSQDSSTHSRSVPTA